MNQNIPPRKPFFIEAEPNPWEEAGQKPVLTLPVLLLYSFTVLICSLYPLLLRLVSVESRAFSALTLAVIAVCALCILLSTRRPFIPLLAALLFFVGCFVGMSTLGPSYTAAGGTIALCLMVAVGAGGFTLLMTRSYWLCIVPALTVFLAFLMTKQFSLAILTLFPYLAAGILAYCQLTNRPRVGTICAVAGLLLLGFVSVALLLLYMQKGVLSATLLLDWLTEVKQKMLQDIAAVLAEESETVDYFASQGVDFAAAMEEAVLLLFNLLPAFTVLAAAILAYLSQLFCIRTVSAFGLQKYVTASAVIFSLSLPSALIFLFCEIVSLFASAESLFSVVCLNLQLILFPGMCIVGFYRLVAGLRQKKGSKLPVLLVLCVIFLPQFVLFYLSVSGAVTTITRRLFLRSMSGGNGFPPEDGANTDGENHRNDSDSGNGQT